MNEHILLGIICTLIAAMYIGFYGCVKSVQSKKRKLPDNILGQLKLFPSEHKKNILTGFVYFGDYDISISGLKLNKSKITNGHLRVSKNGRVIYVNSNATEKDFKLTVEKYYFGNNVLSNV